MTVCRIHEKIPPSRKCELDAWADDSDGLCILHSRRKDKDGQAFDKVHLSKLEKKDYDFSWVVFPEKRLITFDGMRFDKDVSFHCAIFADIAFIMFAKFAGEASFKMATFSGGATFIRTIFSKKTDFTEATFSDEVDFLEATFSDTANFSRANFSGKVNFTFATFSVNACFLNAFFSDESNFIASTLSGEADFCKATLSEKAQLVFERININLGDNNYKHIPFRADFRFLNLRSGAAITFRDLSLTQAQFHGTDLRRVEFERVTWPSWWGRFAVYDEILLHRRRWAHIAYVLKYGGFWWKSNPDEVGKGELGKPSFADFAPVERLYRQLKANYNKEEDYKRVGDFHYGEMEMHRRGSPWRQWLPFSWLNLYRVFSGYGERPLRAFIWLLLLIPAWAGLVWGLGFSQAASQTPINYWDTLLFIFEKATLQRPEWPKGITWLGKVLGSFSVLLLPGQAALFILALRNRLGRRR